MPEFIALSTDAETVATAKTISQVLWDDLNFEREFAFIPRDVYSSIPKATGFADVPFDRWRELNADGLIVGTVTKQSAGFHVEMKLFNVRTRAAVYPRAYDGAERAAVRAHDLGRDPQVAARAERRRAHAADLRLRSRRRADGRHGRRSAASRRSTSPTTTARTSAASPWSDAEHRAALVARRPLDRLHARTGAAARTSSSRTSFRARSTRSPKATRSARTGCRRGRPTAPSSAFSSTRDGNPEIYVVNRDGSGLRRLTNNPSIDITPTWSPSGTQIAFTSDRSGSPQIYVVGVDGLNLSKKTSESFCDRPTWSPAPFNEIAYAARSGPGFDIHVLDLSTGARQVLTFGEGTNESPAFSPNGRHIVFTSTRSGKTQVFTMAKDGKNVRQITQGRQQQQPDWSK